MAINQLMHEAKIIVCKLMLTQARLWNEWHEIEKAAVERAEENADLAENEVICMGGAPDECYKPRQKERCRELTKERERLDNEIARHIARVAAHPELNPHIIYWSVDVFGDASCFSSFPIGRNVSLDVVEDILAKQEEDSIAGESEHYGYRDREEIRTFLKTQGFESTSSGGGCAGWDLGYSCTTERADILCSLLWEHYEYELKFGLLKVTRKASPHLPGMAGWDDAEEFAKEHNITEDY